MSSGDLRLLEALVEQARWAPSGDNTQPWRFQLQPPNRIVLHGHDTRHDCVYDLAGEASQMSIGTLLCTLDLAASGVGMQMVFQRRTDAPPERPIFDVQFFAADREPDPLIDSIQRRAVQRRRMSTQPLTAAQVQRLERAAGPDHSLHWFQTAGERWAIARLLFASADLRLRLPEGYAVHRRIIAWNSSSSQDRIPDMALGASWPTRKLMRFGLQSWERVHFFNRYLAGTLVPRLELDFLPGLACASHMVIMAQHAPQGIDDFVAAGQAVQRVWLAATAEGLWQQPEMTPLIFARYARTGQCFTSMPDGTARALSLVERLDGLLGAEASRAVWMGRLGIGPEPIARSTRLPLSTLIMPPEGELHRSAVADTSSPA
jgi:hypothetical protein